MKHAVTVTGQAQCISSGEDQPVSDQNEGLYDSVSTPANRPEQTSGASPETGGTVRLGIPAEVAAGAAAGELDATAALAEFNEDTRVVGTAPAIVANGAAERAAEDDTIAVEPVEATRAIITADEDEGESERTALLDTAVETAPGAADAAADGAADAAADGAAAGTDAAAQTASERAAREAEVRAQQAEAAARARQKAERDRRLGTVAAATPATALPVAAPAKRTTDRFAGSLGLLLLRIVAAAVVGVLGFQIITEADPVIDALQDVGIPQADMVSMGVGVLALVIAVMILFGLGARIAAALLVALAAATLALFRWGHFNPFTAGRAGFSGDLELLLAGIGLCLLFVGAGGWSIDGGLRRSRARRKSRQD